MSIVDFVRILQVKRYSPNTIKTYESFLKLTQGYFGKEIGLVSETELFDYVYHLIHKKKMAYSTQRQLISALKLYYKEVWNTDISLEHILPTRKPFKIPEVLSIHEVQELLRVTSNLKHHCIIATAYSAGLRVSELLGLRLTDIDSTRMILKVRGGKGAKDRNLPLAEKLLVILRNYYKKYTPGGFLFEGKKGSAYSATSVNAILKTAAKKAKINKQISSHTLRHSYATHLLENGIDIRVIQELLGHRSIKTTMIYTHIAKASLLGVTSPLDF